MSGQDANMADCRQSKTRPQWCHFSTLTESISQTAVEGEGWLKRFKGRQLITSPSLLSLAPHTLRESLHNFVILLRLSYLFYFFPVYHQQNCSYFRLQRKKTLEFDPRIEKTINYAPSTQKMEKNKFIEAKVNLFVICSNMYFEFNLFNIYANLLNFIQKAYSRI